MVCRNEVANPECREVADKAHATLMRVGAKGKVAAPSDEEKAAEAKVCFLRCFLATAVSICTSGRNRR